MKNNFFLTIDVGTKNLAICVCEYKNDSNNINILEKINIIDWEILDVSYKPLYCKKIKNKRAICNCISKYYSLKSNTINTYNNLDHTNPDNLDHTNPDNLEGYCKTHIKQLREYNKKKENKYNQIKNWSINSNPIYKNNFSTQMDKLLIGLENFFNRIILTPYHINSNNLNKSLKIYDLDIYIENQPVFKNPTMKSISVGIYTFFCMKKISYPQSISSINFINATTKTKNDFIIKLSKIIGLKSEIKDFEVYKKRKDFSEDIVNQIINKLNFNQDFFNNIISISYYNITKKKDDLADTLLYQIYIIMYLLKY
jgi:hypothetical protein